MDQYQLNEVKKIILKKNPQMISPDVLLLASEDKMILPNPSGFHSS